MKENIIQIRSFEFVLKIIEIYKKMIAEKEYTLSRQLLRAGTSIGANVEETIGGILKKEFIAKMSIACKEARETKYWLRLIDKSSISDLEFSDAIEEADSILKILTRIIKTSQNK